MKTILYATDYSEDSVAALKYAHDICLRMNAKLLVIHVFNYPKMLDGFGLKAEDAFPDIEGYALKKHSFKLNNFCKEHLGTGLNKINVKAEAIEDPSIVNGIISKAHEIEPLLIITGIKGGRALRNDMMDHTTKHLTEKAPCPVLRIPSGVSLTQIETIVYATDFEEEDLGAIGKLTEIAEPLNANIKIVHIYPLEEKIRTQQKKRMEERIHKHIDYPNMDVEILYSNAIFKDLRIYFGKTNADLIAMLERKSKSLTSQIFHRDLVKKMESYGRIPLISFNAQNYAIFHL